MPNRLHCLERDNLSHAWADAFLLTLTEGEIQPLVVSVTGFTDGRPVESPAVRNALDSTLTACGLQNCHTVATTIFPSGTAARSRSRSDLYRRYERMLPRLKRLSRQNQYGTYFGRMIAHFERRKRDRIELVNQLEHIIQLWKRGGPRRSALFAATVDPAKDHTNQTRRGFPCLLHVAFAPDGQTGLTVTGFFGTQYMFERAYGNYLGLCALGRFVGEHVGRQMTRMTSIAALAVRDVAKRDVAQLSSELTAILAAERQQTETMPAVGPDDAA